MGLLHSIHIRGPKVRAREALRERVDRFTRQVVPENLDAATWLDTLSAARFSPPLPVLLAGAALPDGSFADDIPLSDPAPYAAAVAVRVLAQIGERPARTELHLTLEIDARGPRFVAALAAPQALSAEARGKEPEAALLAAPVGQPPSSSLAGSTR